MDSNQLVDDIVKVFQGDWKSMAAKVVVGLLLVVGYWLIKRALTNAKQQEINKETHEGQAQDQAGNASNVQDIQGKLDSGKDELSKETAPSQGGKLPKHENNGNCPRCDLIFDTYPGFFLDLRTWFKAFQKLHPEAHVSCAGRGKEAQEKCYSEHVSNAHYGESAHNYNIAIDVFEMGGDPKNIYENAWFQGTLKPELDLHPELNWYGRPDAEYKEVPHIEIKSWKLLRASGQIKLVEPI